MDRTDWSDVWRHSGNSRLALSTWHAVNATESDCQRYKLSEMNLDRNYSAYSDGRTTGKDIRTQKFECTSTSISSREGRPHLPQDQTSDTRIELTNRSESSRQKSEQCPPCCFSSLHSVGDLLKRGQGKMRSGVRRKHIKYHTHRNMKRAQHQRRQKQLGRSKRCRSQHRQQ